jgi:hypothetical protein
MRLSHRQMKIIHRSVPRLAMMAAKLKVEGYLIKPISAKPLGARLQSVLDDKKTA